MLLHVRGGPTVTAPRTGATGATARIVAIITIVATVAIDIIGCSGRAGRMVVLRWCWSCWPMVNGCSWCSWFGGRGSVVDGCRCWPMAARASVVDRGRWLLVVLVVLVVDHGRELARGSASRWPALRRMGSLSMRPQWFDCCALSRCALSPLRLADGYHWRTTGRNLHTYLDV